ncbi:LuxR C-terminal-related transcriptional regulator [Paenibacillus medicaginis]|uniref:LuxR C-terminal-related transcriptional regulator n=1 Tax=Paenibacillus medicaginis TaxID=1470560 RepID=A0ABV5BVA6_9BACL
MDQRILLEVNDHFPNILSMSEFKERLIERKEILHLLQEETRSMNDMLSIPFLLVIANPDGTIVDYYGTDSLKGYFERNNIRNGTSFAMEYLGINAISLSMEHQAVSVVIGDEHSNKLFAELSWVCTPIRIKNVIIGYLSLCFHYFHEVTFALPLIEHLARNIEEKLPQKDPVLQKELTYSLFDQYELTNREKEIAYGWLENKNVPEIADIYGISESTVRTFIKKIYAKTRVNHKGAFLKKFS